jgi:hypothetical protein
LDNSVGIADLVVARSDWGNRWQLNTLVAGSRVGGFDYSTDHWSASRSLITATCFPTERSLFKERVRAKGG